MEGSSWARSFKDAALPAVLALAIALLALHALYIRDLFLGNCLDDAYISFRYADNLAAGHGLVFNPGERVEGYSNFLWVLLLLPFASLGDLTLPAQILGLALGAVGLGLAVAALRSAFGVRSPLAAAFVALLLAGSGYWAGWAVGGLETALYGLLILATWFRYSVEQSPGGRARRPWSAPLFAALALARPEGLFLALGGVAYHSLFGRTSRPRDKVVYAALVLALLVAYESWRFAYFGPRLFPNTFYAKVGFEPAQVARGVRHVASGLLLPYLPLVLVPAVLVFRRGRRAGEAAGVGMLSGYLLFVVLVGGDWSWGRFLAPVLPLGAVLLAGSLATTPWLARLFRQRPARAAACAVAIVYLGIAFFVTSVEREMAHRIRWAETDAERIRLGRWLAEHAPPETVIAVYAAGQVPYYSGLYTHDMLGITEPHIAHRRIAGLGRGIAGHEKHDAAYTLETVRPHVIIDGGLVPGMRHHPLYTEGYVEDPRWRWSEVRVRRDLAGR